MHKLIAAASIIAVAIVGAWIFIDVGAVAAMGPESLEANAALARPCYVTPLRAQLDPEFAVIGDCIDPIDVCPNIAGIQRRLPLGYQFDEYGNCVPITPVVDVCPNIPGVQTTMPPGYQLDGAGNCVPVTPPAVLPSCTLTVSPSSVTYGNGATLSWTTTNADTFSISGVGLVATPAAGTQSVTPLTTTTYTGTAMNANGSKTCATALTVLADQLNNGGFEQQGTAATNAYDWQGYGNGYTRVSGGRTGTYSMLLQNASSGQTSGAYQRIDLLQTTTKPVFIGGYVRGSGIVMAPGSWIGASIYAEIYFTDGTVAYWNSIPNSGTFNWRWIGFNTGTLPTQKPIDHIFLIPILASASGAAYFDDIAVTPINPVTKSAVTIMFDDGEATDFTQAKPVMDQYGFKGTSAIPVNDLGNPGVMTALQVQQLQAAGWEVVSHALNNDTNLMNIAPAQAIAAITTSKSLLQSLGLTVKNFAWPFGAYNAELVGATQSAGYSSARTFESGNNPQGAFPYDIKVRQVTNATTPAQVAQWLQEGKTNNRWEILSFHIIAPSGDDAYYTTPATFAQIMAVIAQSGVPVMTYNQALLGFATVGGPNPVTPLPPNPNPPNPPRPPIDPIDPCGGRLGGRLICQIQ